MSKKQQEKIEVICQECRRPRVISRGTYQQVVKRNGFYRCADCSPQRNKKFWKDKDRKEAHSKAVKSSSAYYEAIGKRDLSGDKNGMFGKTHSPQTIAKMSKSRTGKIGKNATAWKGGKSSFTSRIKKLIHTRYDWYQRIFIRDGSKCMHCGSTEQLDAHHIEPVVQIIKRIIIDQTFDDEDAKLEWVISHPDIQDSTLENGIILCRVCHKKVHNNWGSHVKP